MKVTYFSSRESKTEDKAAVDETEKNKSDITNKTAQTIYASGR